jgi:selT/selW/selH-like putative selenoprotein
MASRLAAAIKKEMGFDAELIPGERGVFDVAADGKRLFSKHSAGRFPDPDEIISALRSL